MQTLEKDRIESKVKMITGELLGHEPSELKCPDNFKEDLGADSLDCVEIRMRIEAEYCIDIPDYEFEKFATIRDVVDYVDAIVNPIGI